MGKVKPRLIGDIEIEEKQKKEQKEKAAKKKAVKSLEKKNVSPKPLTSSKTSISQKPQKSQKKGRAYEEAKKIVDKTKTYSLTEAVSLLKKMKLAKFDESIELHLVVDEKGLKGEVELPYSTGKTVRVAVVDDKVLTQIEKGKLDFDILVTHPSYMPKLAKYAKILGPKGLMPNPKAGTISSNPEEVVKRFAKGLLKWKTEPKAPLIHQMIGKKSIEEKQLVANCQKFIQAVGSKHILKAYIKSTMSPAIKVRLD